MPSQSPKISLCQLSFPFTSFDEDIEIAKAVGARGLGLDESKLAANEADRTTQRKRFADAGLSATICCGSVLSILPRDPARDKGPRSPKERIDLITKAIDKLAAFGADSVFCATGPTGDFSASEARKIVVEGYRVLAARAAAAGTRFAIEPMREPMRPLWTIVNGFGETAALFDDIGCDNLGIVFDTWHLWDSPDLRKLLPGAVKRLVGVQIADYRNPTRGIRDRVAAGEGVSDIKGLIRIVRDAGFDGWYDMEVFSDLEFEDSLWKLTPRAFAERQMQGFLKCWQG